MLKFKSILNMRSEKKEYRPFATLPKWRETSGHFHKQRFRGKNSIKGLGARSQGEKEKKWYLKTSMFSKKGAREGLIASP